MDYEYDSLLDEDPEVQERVIRGEIQIAQELVTGVVEARFPTLAKLAKERVTSIRSTALLKQLVKQAATAPDEKTLHWLLDTYAA